MMKEKEPSIASPDERARAGVRGRSDYDRNGGSYAETVRTLLIALGIAAGVWAAAIVGLLVIGRRTAARQLATLLPSLVRLFHALFRDPRVPRGSKVLLGFALAWFVSPIDLVPEFIPVIGPLDDAVVAALVLRHVLRKAGRDVIAEHWSGDQATLGLLLRVAGPR
jgi:uncharacterized membrane protein YkvA (DUF1232 family)